MRKKGVQTDKGDRFNEIAEINKQLQIQINKYLDAKSEFTHSELLAIGVDRAAQYRADLETLEVAVVFPSRRSTPDYQLAVERVKNRQEDPLIEELVSDIMEERSRALKVEFTLDYDQHGEPEQSQNHGYSL